MEKKNCNFFLRANLNGWYSMERKKVFFYFFLFIFNVYMQPHGYDRPLAFRPFLSTPSQKSSFFSPFPRCLAAFFFLFLFFSSCFMSICNPVGYDRPECPYIQKSSPAWCPLIVHFRAVSPRLTHDIWGLSPPNSGLN